jgi:hypothetical protein
VFVFECVRVVPHRIYLYTQFPFLSSLLKRLKEAFEDSSQVALLAALDRPMLPPVLHAIQTAWRAHERATPNKTGKTFNIPQQTPAEVRAFSRSLVTVTEGLALSPSLTNVLKT